MTPDPTALARLGLRIYAINKDPLTASAVEIAFKAKPPRLTEVEKSAVELLRRQVDAYTTLFPDALE